MKLILTEEQYKLLLKEESSNVTVYHATDKKFSIFKDNSPMFFVDDIDVAKTYGEYLIAAKVSMNNPIELNFNGKSTYYFIDKWYLPSELAIKIKELSKDIQKYGLLGLEEEIQEELVELDWSDSYGDLDGIIMKDINDSYEMSDKIATNYIVFEKSQINIINK